MSAGVVLANATGRVAVLADSQHGAGGSIALEPRARAAGHRGGVARVRAAVVLDGVCVVAGRLGLLAQLVEILADRVIALHATAAANDVLARAFCLVLGFRGRM